MWDGLFMLLALGTIMAIASFLAGSLPLSFSLSHRQLRFIALLGTGVLVGTSLIVIIPEGIETMYSASRPSPRLAHEGRPAPVPEMPHPPKQQGPANGFGGAERSETDSIFSFNERADAVNIVVERTPELKAVGPVQRQRRDDKGQNQKASDTAAQREKEEAEHENHDHAQKGGDDDSTEGHKEGHSRVHPPEEPEKEEPHPHEDEHQEHGDSPHGYIGVALVLGFILMFAVDHLPEALSPSRSKYSPLHISLSDLSRGPHNSSSLSVNMPHTPHTPSSPMPEMIHRPHPPPRSSATTIGLIIHAFADGIALGASSTAPSMTLSLIIFVAIMLHKAPAAFGLTSVLLKQGLNKRTARTHLLFFSLSAPAGALFTWAIVHALGREVMGGDLGLQWTTGWVLLFSGGTFLYVAMHSLAEATSQSDESYINGYMDPHHGSSLSKVEIATCMLGMLIPLVTQVGHVH